MPLTPDAEAGPDTSELGAGAPISPQLPVAPVDEDGTGANSPKYSGLDVWASAARTTVVGKLGLNADLRAESGYNFMNPGPQVDTEGLIPPEMLPWKDKYVDLHTAAQVRFRTAQLKQSFEDAQTMGSSKWGGLAAIAMGQSDPVALASLAIPIGAATRIGTAVRMGLVGAGVSAVDEMLLHKMDPTATFQGSIENIGAGTLLSGLLGAAIRPHVPPAEFERLRAQLQEDLNRGATPAPVIPEGDTAAAIASDLRAAVERHDTVLTSAAQAHGQAAAHLDPQEVQARVQAAQERLEAVGEPAAGKEAAAAPAGAGEHTEGPPEMISHGPAVGDEAIAHERDAARAEYDAALADQARLERAAAAHGELAKFRAPTATTEEPVTAPTAAGASGEPQGYHVDEQELTDELRQKFAGLRSEVHPAEGAQPAGGGESARPVPGGSAGRAEPGAEAGAGAGGQPHPVYRGGRGGPLTPEHFLPESFGKATERPSSGLGVFFTNDPAEAGLYGTVTTHHLDLRNPLELKSEDVPGFDSKEAATAWRDQQIAAGHDGLVIDASHLGGQTWYVPFKFEQVLRPAGSTEAAHQAALIAKAPSPALKRAIGDPVLREQLQDMADRETGWETEGGRVIRDPDTEQVTGRTKWIPNAEWWPGRPGGYNPEAVQAIVKKALAGERLGPKQQALIEYMTEVADARVANEPYLPHAEEFEGLDEHLHAGNVADEHETAMVARLALIDETAVENLARHFEDDHAGFMNQVRRMLDAHDTDASLAHSGEPDRETPGEPVDRAPPERVAAAAGGPGEPAATKHGPLVEYERGESAGNTGDVRKPVAPVPEGFTTAKGSTYEVTARGTTVRNKAARAEHPGESGPQPESDRTFYVRPEDAEKLGEFQTQGAGKRAVIESNGRAGVKYLEGKDAGKIERRTLVDIHDAPAEGLIPVELWKDGTSVHFGNEITEIRARPAAEPAAAPARDTRKPMAQDLFGDRPTGAQALADETRRRDALRNSGQESIETGRPDDLFSQARHQTDLTALLERLPPADQAAFEARLAALDSAPIVAAPGDSTAGAMQVGAPITLKDLSFARGGRVLGKALSWFAPGSRVLHSPSLEVRKASISLVETPEMLEMNVPTPERPQGLPTPPAVETILKRWEGMWAQGFAARDQLYRIYRARPEYQLGNEKMGKGEFNEAVSAAMRRGDQSPHPEVQAAAEATRRLVFDPLKVEAQKLGLLPQQEDLLQRTAESYLMRQYDRAKIRANRPAWHTLLRDGFIAQGVDSSEADTIAHQVTSNLLGSEMGLLDLNDSVFKGVVPSSGRLEQRTILLPDIALEHFLVNDIDSLSHSYLKSLAPQVEITRRFGDRSMQETFKSISDEYSILKQRALSKGDSATANKLSDRQRADLRDLAAMRDRMYGIFGVPADPSGWWQRSGRVIRSVNAFRLLGTATWSHLPDAANVIMSHGLPGTMATAAKLSTSLEALNLNRTELHRFGTALDMVHNSTAAQLGEFGVDSNYAFQKFLNRGTRAFTIATLETPWIASIKAVAGAVAHDQILETAERAANGGRVSTNERIRMNKAGLGQGMLERIGAQYQKYGRQVNGLRFGMSDKWTDQGAQRVLEAAVNRHAEGSTLSPSKGDTPLWTSTEIGKAIFQFKTFGAVATRKVLIPLAQGLAHADLRSAQGLATLIAAGAATYTMKQLLAGQPIEKNAARYALEVLDKSNLLGWTGEYFYPVLWQAGMSNFSRWGDRQTWETLGGPVAGTAVDAWDLRLPAKIRGQMTADPTDAHFTRSDIHRIRRMLPGNQVWYWRQAVNALEGKVGDTMGLPPAAVRGSTE